jgi:hypothetical protein
MKESGEGCVRVKCLRRGESLRITQTSDLTLFCCAGRVAIDQEDENPRLYLGEGQQFTSRSDRPIVISFCAGPKDEWLAEIGIAVFAVSRSCP